VPCFERFGRDLRKPTRIAGAISAEENLAPKAVRLVPVQLMV
jgi:hypothetical protein